MPVFGLLAIWPPVRLSSVPLSWDQKGELSDKQTSVSVSQSVSITTVSQKGVNAMARFYGAIQGNRGEATRVGHSSMYGHIRGWRVGGRVSMSIDQQTGEDVCTIELTYGSGNRGYSHTLGVFTASDLQARELALKAEGTACQRGHSNLAWHWSTEGTRVQGLGICICCKRTVTVDTSPPPNGIDICGSAIGEGCTTWEETE